jgi:HAD superfamily hydrolase (TIGR01662 family)
MTTATVRAVFFDVDFTLIRPGRAFEGEGYREFCARHGVDVDPSAFDGAVAAASSMLDADGGRYDPAVFVEYTRRIIEGMGGLGPAVDLAARDIYDEWSACHHFTLYEEVPEVLRSLRADGFTIGLISNTQRSLVAFERHFELDGLFAVAISSFDHGYMKPHPSIFEEALRRADVRAGEAVMVGDSLRHDVEGALRLGMRGVLVARSRLSVGCPPEIPVIQSLRELRPLL